MKTDNVEARILAQLLAANFLPAVWLPDDRTRMLRRQVSTNASGAAAHRLKNQVHAILARNLVPTCPVSYLFGKTGRHWLAQQPLPADERRSVDATAVTSASNAHLRSTTVPCPGTTATSDPPMPGRHPGRAGAQAG